MTSHLGIIFWSNSVIHERKDIDVFQIKVHLTKFWIPMYSTRINYYTGIKLQNKRSRSLQGQNLKIPTLKCQTTTENVSLRPNKSSLNPLSHTKVYRAIEASRCRTKTVQRPNGISPRPIKPIQIPMRQVKGKAKSPTDPLRQSQNPPKLSQTHLYCLKINWDPKRFPSTHLDKPKTHPNYPKTLSIKPMTHQSVPWS